MPNTEPSPEVLAERERCDQILALAEVAGGTVAMRRDAGFAIRRGTPLAEFRQHLVVAHHAAGVKQ